MARKLELQNLRAEKRYRREVRGIVRGVVQYYSGRIVREDAVWLAAAALVTRSIKRKVGIAFDRMWDTVAANVAAWLTSVVGRGRDTADLDKLKAEARELAIEGVQRIHEEYVQQVNDTVTPPSEERTAGLAATAEDKGERSAELGAVAAQGLINESEQQAAKVPAFYWLTKQDDRVRELHADVGEQVYSWGSLPLDDDGDEFAPGTQIGCRCVAVPSELDGSVDVQVDE